MAASVPLTVHVPIKGKLLIRLDGTETLHEVGDFSQDVPVVFTPGPGEVSFQFEEKFWEGAVKRGRESDPRIPHPNLSTATIIEEAIVENLQRWATHDTRPGMLAIDGIVDLRELSGKIASALEQEGRLA